jgi:predicted alpha/beta superfamily hydrolase
MKTFILFFLLISSSLFSQHKITFLLHTPGLPDTAIVFITGNMEQLGYWNPSFVNMERAGENSWKKTISEVNINQIEYKYTLGSWEREAADTKGSPLSNLTAKIYSDTIIQDIVLNWTNNKVLRENKGQITGNIEYHRNLSYPNLQSRDLIVWLPPDYNTTETRYPVLYMHDGQNLFDPATSSFGIDWQIDEILDSLIRHDIIPPIIVVGINNTTDRMREYLPGEKGDMYQHFVIKKVKPLIDSLYRTKPDQEFTFTGGSSAGGSLSFMLLWEHPEIFSAAICMSPAFKEPGEKERWNYIKIVDQSQKRDNIQIYIDLGGKGIDYILQEGVSEMVNALIKKGYKMEDNLLYLLDHEAEHTESAWTERFPKAIKFILDKK